MTGPTLYERWCSANWSRPIIVKGRRTLLWHCLMPGAKFSGQR